MEYAKIRYSEREGAEDMNRKEKIYQCVCRLVEDQEEKTGVDSITISEELELNRSNVSRDLNELVREGRIVKLGGRPVYFMETSGV